MFPLIVPIKSKFSAPPSFPIYLESKRKLYLPRYWSLDNLGPEMNQFNIFIQAIYGKIFLNYKLFFYFFTKVNICLCASLYIYLKMI